MLFDEWPRINFFGAGEEGFGVLGGFFGRFDIL
jgi:hypothetical protein